MTNKYLEKVARMSEEEIDALLARQAAKNTLRTYLLGPAGVGFNIVYSPETLADIREDAGLRRVRKAGDWVIPATAGVGGFLAGSLASDIVARAIERGVPHGTLLGHAIRAVGATGGTLLGTQYGLKQRIKDALISAREGSE